jgi:DNA anti-recombination protein RmuC
LGWDDTPQPEQKHLIVDAKVSLVAYDEYVNADSDPIREIALKKHMASIRAKPRINLQLVTGISYAKLKC